MRVIALLNQKGGVGKTSLCHHLAGAFGRLGKSVLLVDLDPQASLSQGLFGPDMVRGMDPDSTAAAILGVKLPFPEDLIRTNVAPRTDIVPGSKAATDHNIPRPFDAPIAAQASLRNFLHEVEVGPVAYDLVLVDCPPNLHLCSWAALAAAHHLVVPLQPEDYASQGLPEVEESAAHVRASINPTLTTLGFVLTRVIKRQSIHRVYEAELRELYGDKVFTTRIPSAAAYAEAIARRRPIEQYQPRSNPAHEMRALAFEILLRAGLVESPCPAGSVAEVI